ncbi:hypothetical protein M426DRAFT_67361 [Hypoxylon sp. CI-4A]|nr:hypothetical protein M426DRAFT_67361 [Hypoxylon sp. CI-4A]
MSENYSHANQVPSTLSLDSLILEDPPTDKPSLYRRCISIVSTQVTGAFREALSDIKSVRWARAGLWTLFFIWTMIILGLFTFFVIYSTFSSTFESYNSACRSDGSFNMNPAEYRVWTASSFFEINIGFGELAFTEAKVIDVAWDIIIGRGGQALMAFLSWRAFADYVTTSMEFAPITYTLFSIIFLQDEPSIWSTFQVARTFIFNRGLKSRLSMVFMVLCMLFLIGWPTFASAMTGYTTIGKAFVPDFNSNYIPFSNFQPIVYVIHDGSRIDLTDDYPVPMDDNSWADSGKKAIRT